MSGRKRQTALVRAPIPDEDGGDLEASVAAPRRDRAVARQSVLTVYLQDIRRHRLLTRGEETDLARRYAHTHDPEIGRQLVTANLRLVVKIAQEYRRAHRNVLDLIQEGNLGLIQAVERYDPFRGIRLSSYAAWWIRAYILKFILANWRMVKIGTTQAQRRLFFNLRRERDRLEKQGLEVDAKRLAKALDVSETEVAEMERRLSWSEMSLDTPARDDPDGANGRAPRDMVPAAAAVRPDVKVEAGEFDRILRAKLEAFGSRLRDRELDIFRKRLLAEQPATLEQIGADNGVSRERARQLEDRLRKKLRRYLEDELGDAIDPVPAEPAARTPASERH
jgi:RNA polymerase sigma-32 factor